MKNALCVVFLPCLLLMFLGGVMAERNYQRGSSPQQVIIDKQYEQCTHNLPRNKDCKFISANFEIVYKGKL